MRKREITVYTVLIVFLSVMTTNLAARYLTGRSLIELFYTNQTSVMHQPVTLDGCTQKEKIAGLEQASDPHLKKLHLYQEMCNSFVTDRLMLFIDIPKDEPLAKQNAQKLALVLQEFNKYGVTPIVIVEPVSEWGLIDFEEFGTGFYDDWIRAFFNTLQEHAITDADMGIWVPFPEPNLPLWNHNNATPKDFSLVVNKYLGILKQVFPEARASILLNSATYETSDFDWANGEYVSLLPYVSDINPEYIDSFGLQGFPWMPPKNQPGSGIFDAAEYLNSNLAQEAADTLRVREIWFNTGTFSAKYTLEPERTATLSPGKRDDILQRTISEVAQLQSQGYTVWINLFAEDKSDTNEATDWSYFSETTTKDPAEAHVLKNFTRRLEEKNIPLSLFDIMLE